MWLSLSISLLRLKKRFFTDKVDFSAASRWSSSSTCTLLCLHSKFSNDVIHSCYATSWRHHRASLPIFQITPTVALPFHTKNGVKQLNCRFHVERSLWPVSTVVKSFKKRRNFERANSPLAGWQFAKEAYFELETKGDCLKIMKRRGKQTEYQAAIKKFFEESKEPLKRLKLLKHGMGKY